MKRRARRITEKWQKRDVQTKKMERIEKFEILEKAILETGLNQEFTIKV